MRGLIVSLVGAALWSGAAAAADAPTKAVAPLPTAYDWSGHYLGVGLGWGQQSINSNWVAPPPDAFNTSGSRGWFDVNLGIQKQWGNWVVGVEGSYALPLSQGYDSSTTGPNCVSIILTPNFTCSARILDLWTVGGKVGYAAGRWMLYGQAGYANANVDGTASNGITTAQLAAVRHDGWYVGLGTDVLVTSLGKTDILAGLQYRHIELANAIHFGLGSATQNAAGKIDMISARLTLKWNGHTGAGY